MLKEAIDTYLAVRRAGGFKLEDEELYLHNFARFAAARGETHVVAKTAITWAAQTSSEPQRAQRLKVVIRFARFSRAEDPRHELPPSGVFRTRRQRPVPHLYTDEEIRALMARAANLGPVGSLRPHIYSTLIGLLAATGLRISEALGLRLRDVTSDGLIVREAKFGKSRLVPLHPTTQAALDEYLLERDRRAIGDDHLFVTQRGSPLTRGTVYKTFHQLLAAAGLPRRSDQPRPRLVDFRHTFASNALVDCQGNRDHIGQHMLALMTYMGHAHPSSTYYYLECSPQLMDDIVRACERMFREVEP